MCLYTDRSNAVSGARSRKKRSAVREPAPATVEEAPTRKNIRLRQSKLDAARKALGTTTETETIERALDLAAFGERLASGTRRARGRVWNDVASEMENIDPEPDE